MPYNSLVVNIGRTLLFRTTTAWVSLLHAQLHAVYGFQSTKEIAQDMCLATKYTIHCYQPTNDKREFIEYVVTVSNGILTSFGFDDTLEKENSQVKATHFAN